VNLAVHFIRERSSLILSYPSHSFFYIMLLVGVVGRKKKIKDGERCEIDQFSITGRMVFHILFIDC